MLFRSHISTHKYTHRPTTSKLGQHRVNKWMDKGAAQLNRTAWALSPDTREPGKPWGLGQSPPSELGLQRPGWGLWPWALSSHPGYAEAWMHYEVPVTVGKNLGVPDGVPGHSTFPDSLGLRRAQITVHCPILACLWVFHRREADTHHGFLWPSSSLPLLVLCLLWLNFLLLLLSEHHVKYPNVVWAGRYHEACNLLAVVMCPKMCYQFPFPKPHPHTHLPTPAIRGKVTKKLQNDPWHHTAPRPICPYSSLAGFLTCLLSPLLTPTLNPKRLFKWWKTPGLWTNGWDGGCSWREEGRKGRDRYRKCSQSLKQFKSVAERQPWFIHTTTVSGLKPHTTQSGQTVKKKHSKPCIHFF